MPDNYKAILQELCGTALNMPAGELQQLLAKADGEVTEDEVTQISEKIKGHYRNIMSQINSSNIRSQDEKFKAGERKKAKEFEDILKEKFNVTSEKYGQELIDEIVVSLNKSRKNKGDELTDDDIRRHPFYLKAESDFKKQLKEAQDKEVTSVTNLKKEYEKKETFNQVSKQAIALFESLNPVLSDDPKKAAAQKQLIVDKLSEYEFQEVDGKFVPVKDGKVLEDEFKHAYDLEKLVKSTSALFFDFKVATPRKSANGEVLKPGDPDYIDPKDNKYSGPLPKNETEWQNMMNDPNVSLTDKMVINEHWEKQSAAAV